MMAYEERTKIDRAKDAIKIAESAYSITEVLDALIYDLCYVDGYFDKSAWYALSKRLTNASDAFYAVQEALKPMLDGADRPADID